MKKSEEYAAATFAACIEEIVTTDTFATNDERYVAAATLAFYNEEFHTDKNIVKGHANPMFNQINEEGDVSNASRWMRQR
jgi:hypothetical protein